MIDLPKNKKIILFDGVCNLCESSVQFIIKYDTKDVFRFVALQSELGKEILKHIGISPINIDSIILYEPGIAYYYKSSAALGRRYARSDEIGVPFAVTVDFDTLTDDTVTIRERDSMIQVRVPKSEVTNIIFSIVHKRITW